MVGERLSCIEPEVEAPHRAMRNVAVCGATTVHGLSGDEEDPPR